MTQLFEELPGTVAISEPEALMPFAADRDLFRKNANDESEDESMEGPKRKEYLRAVIEALCFSARKEIQNANNRRCNIVIKPKAHGIGVTKELADLYPEMHHLYLFRHPTQYVTSLKSVFDSLLHPVIHSTLMRLSIKMGVESFLLSHFSRLDHPKARQMKRLIDTVEMKKNKLNLFAALFCSNMMSVQEQSEYGINFKVVSYHELIEKENVDRIVIDLARFCHIDHDNRVELPEGDSQTNSGLSRQHLQSYKKSLGEDEIELIDNVLNECGFPSCKDFPIDSHSMATQVLKLP